MRKMLLIPLILCMVALLPTLWMPAVYATEPIPVVGVWAWTVPIIHDEHIAGDNYFMSAVEADVFTGTFDGTGWGDFKIVVHLAEGYITGEGRTTFTGTVEGRTGTCVIRWAGNTDNEQGWWWFMWVILSGTEGLENLHGQGTCWGPGPGGVDMSGQIHFEPD